MDRYYYALIDLCKKTVQLRECSSCQAVDIQTVCNEYSINADVFNARFRYCFIGTNTDNFSNRIYKYARKFIKIC